VLLDPRAELVSWRLGDPATVITSLGEEDGSQALFLNGNEKPSASRRASDCYSVHEEIATERYSAFIMSGFPSIQ
jgi:hypothetical protein